MWDPVENAGLLPWFTATAFLHSVMVQERRSMLRVWNVTLVILTFMLTIFGTFMTRSGVVSSVHAFGSDPVLAWLFTWFMIGALAFSFGWVIYRLPLLRARNELDSWLSREAAFLANNWILLFCAFFILFGTMFPTLSEAVTGDRITVAAPFFNLWMTPIGLVLLTLAGVGPLLAWRKSTLKNLRDQFLWPVIASIVTLAGVTALGIPFWASGLCFALCGLVFGTIVQEFWRGASVRRRNSGTDFFTALVGLVGRNKRRYGGYIVHLGVVLIVLGFAGEGLKQDRKLLMTPGQTVDIGRYTVRFDKLGVGDDGQKQAVTAYMTVMKGGDAIASLYPARWFFRGRESEPTTEVAIRRTVAEDLYIVMAAYDPGPQHVQFEIYLNPLVNWIWLGFGIIALGTIVALLPERSYAFALARMPADAVTTTAAFLLMLILAAPAAAGQGDGLQNALVGPLEKRVGDALVCICSDQGCGKKTVGSCSCSTADRTRAEIVELVKAGKTEQEILDHFVAKHGSYEVLGAPPNRGFNRLAWLFPYLLGAGGALVVGTAAVRWAHRRESAGSGEAAPADPDLEERLDDELRSLD
jgi:cytochrome c-type biogenesis protein CcmF